MTEYDPDYVSVKNYVLVAQKAVICCLNQLLILRRSDKAGGEGLENGLADDARFVLDQYVAGKQLL